MAALVGRTMLRSPRAGALERVRAYGLALGLLGGALPQVAGLSALAALAVATLLACAPGRGAWESVPERRLGPGRPIPAAR